MLQWLTGGGGGREVVCVALVEITSLVVDLRGLAPAAGDIEMGGVPYNVNSQGVEKVRLGLEGV